jgi:ribosomal protein S18 acetylase RimI-like enzyme
MLEKPFRQATQDDADSLAELINFAGEGMPHYLWTGMAEPDETAWDVGRRRARRDEGSFSFRNAVVVEEEGEVVAALIGYPLPETPEPIDYDAMPAMFVPMQELENLAPGTWYINVVAVYPERRNRGYGTRLLGLADRIAAGNGLGGLSLIVSDANVAAIRLYEGIGFREVARRPMVKDDWENRGQNWVLMTKAI